MNALWVVPGRKVIPIDKIQWVQKFSPPIQGGFVTSLRGTNEATFAMA